MRCHYRDVLGAIERIRGWLVAHKADTACSRQILSRAFHRLPQGTLSQHGELKIPGQGTHHCNQQVRILFG